MIDMHAFSRGLSIHPPSASSSSSSSFWGGVGVVDPDFLDFGIRIASDHARSR
jgi:hypothetical protein